MLEGLDKQPCQAPSSRMPIASHSECNLDHYKLRHEKAGAWWRHCRCWVSCTSVPWNRVPWRWDTFMPPHLCLLVQLGPRAHVPLPGLGSQQLWQDQMKPPKLAHFIKDNRLAAACSKDLLGRAWQLACGLLELPGYTLHQRLGNPQARRFS